MPPELSHINCWIFDLDNTLYPASTDLFALIDVRMGLYIQTLLGVDAAEARRIQKHHFVEHGTTLCGLMREQDIDPREFLDFVHEIDLDRIAADPALKMALMRLPGRKLVYTNGNDTYAEAVLAKLDLQDCFEAIYDIHLAHYRPKPEPEAISTFCTQMKVDPARALFVEDMARNLKPAKDLGMTTVWINNGSELGTVDASTSYIDYETHCASAWLNQISGESIA